MSLRRMSPAIDPAPACGERNPHRISRERGDFEHVGIGYIAGAGLERVAIPRPGSRVIIRRPPKVRYRPEIRR